MVYGSDVRKTFYVKKPPQDYFTSRVLYTFYVFVCFMSLMY